MANLICLGGSIESLPILRRAREMGHRLIVVDKNENAPGYEFADGLVIASCYHATETLDTLKEFFCIGCDYKPDGVLCAAIDAPNVASAVAEAFGLPGLSVEAAGLGADKLRQVITLTSASCPCPNYEYGFPPESTKHFEGWVIKPLDSRGARGVMRLLPGVDPTWAYEQARAQSPTGRVMVEEWLDGPQLSTESLVQDGRVLFTAVGLRNYARLDEFAPYVVEDGFDSPYDAPDVDELIERACLALDWYQSGGGVVKGDLVIYKEKLHVIELAPRLSGGLFCAAHELAYGVDFIGAAINMALGYTAEMPKPYSRQFVSQRYIFPSAQDIGKRIAAQEERDYGAVFAYYSKPIGHIIAPVTSHPDRLGQALCVGATAQEARERAERTVKEMYNGMVIE